MNILSIYPYTHISSSALMIDNEIVSASAEERFNREKFSTKFPSLSSNWCLKKNKLTWKDINYIVIPWNPSINLNNVSGRWVNDMRWRGEMIPNILGNVLRHLDGQPPLNIELLFEDKKIIFYDHHLCHAASAYYTSGFSKAHILSIDGHGENETCFLGVGKGKKIKKIDSIKYPHSVGLFYGTITDFLGFKADQDEWKVMALTSYSSKINKYDKLFENLFNLNKKSFELNLNYFNYYLFDRQRNFFTEKFIKLFGLPRKKDDPITSRHYQIAGALQRSFSKIVTHIVKILKNKDKSIKDICLAGGAAMNCVYNAELNKSKIYENLFIPPFPDDLGVSVGACYLANNILNNKSKNSKIISNYWGPSYKNSEIEKILINNKINFQFMSDNKLNKYIASEISKGKLVGWFRGGMEFGQRALGNRSILADARNKKIKKILNEAIKYREGFRPFAPICLSEKASNIFKIKKNEEFNFMEKVAYVKDTWAKKIPGVVHVDNSARLQTVTKKINLNIYNLLREFDNITKIPLLVNTSLNLNGEPICMSPEHALRSFYSCGLDILVLENYIIAKE
jgi:carbamoyltransferase